MPSCTPLYRPALLRESENTYNRPLGLAYICYHFHSAKTVIVHSPDSAYRGRHVGHRNKETKSEETYQESVPQSGGGWLKVNEKIHVDPEHQLGAGSHRASQNRRTRAGGRIIEAIRIHARRARWNADPSRQWPLVFGSRLFRAVVNDYGLKRWA